MIRTNRNFILDILAATILFATVIVYQGYQYGQSDQSQILPVLYAQDHPGTYSNDQYVTAYLKSGVNERTLFHFILRYSGYDKPWLVFIWHALFSIALIVAWIMIARMFIASKNLQYICIGCILIIGFHTSVGSNEIYYNQFIPSVPAKAIASWAIFYWLGNRFGSWALLLVLSTFLQPLVGLQLFILTTGAQVIAYLQDKRKEKLPLASILVYMIFVAPWIVLLAANNGGQHDPKGFMDIMEFRLSHHFFASYFGIFHLIVFVVFAVLCILFFKKKLKWMIILVLAGCVVYEVGVEILRLPLFLYVQWWKTTIWLEAFSIVAIVSFLDSEFQLKQKLKMHPVLMPVILLGIISFYRLSGLFGPIPTYMSPLYNKPNVDVGISLYAKNLTPAGSVFILPPDLTAFRWYSQRNTYVDHKALFHQEAFLKEWYNRIQQVYHYDLQKKKSGVSFHDQAYEIVNNPAKETIDSWKSLGITHLISPNPAIPSLELLGSNTTYSIYKL